MLCRGEELFLAYTAVFIHEAVHYLTARACRVYASEAEADIFGIRLRLPYILGCTDRIIISASGPLASFVVFIALQTADSIIPFMGRRWEFFAFANFCIGIVNLLPMSPLDGGGILKAVLARFFGVILGGRIFRAVSIGFCMLFLSFVLVSVFMGIFNPTLIMLSAFLFMGIRNESHIALNEKRLILQGETPLSSHLRYIAYDGNTSVLTAVSRINADRILHTAVFSEGRFIGELTQNELIFALKTHGAMTALKDCLEK